jgi:hypothetical protein
LQDSELEALRNLNAGALYRMGAHSFLLWQFARMMDLKPASGAFERFGRR